MDNIDLNTARKETRDLIRDQLARVLESPDFVRSERLRDFLTFIVEQALAGKADELKGYTVAVEVFGRETDFDPQTDSVVRIHAGRLRRALERYYFKQGAQDSLLIEVPKGAYAPVFSLREAAVPVQVDEAVDPSYLELPPGPAVVVLPFQDLSSAEIEDHFAAGLTIEVNSQLARFQEIRVLGPQTGGFVGSQSGNRIVLARQTGARFMLEGTVRRETDRLRIAVTLTDTQNGVQVWSESFDRGSSPNEILEIEREIAAKVSARIGDSFGHIPRQLSKETRNRETQDPAALAAILRFNHHQFEWTADGHAETLAALEEAAAADPQDALVLSYLSEHLQDDIILMLFSAEDAEERSWKLANRSVHLEPRLQRAQFAKAYSHLQRREFEAFFEHAEIVMELNPNAAYTVGFIGWAMALAGRWERGLAILAKGMELNPHYPSWFHHAPCLYHLQKGALESALSQARAFIMPGMSWDPLHRASILGHLGHQAQARRALTELLALDPEFADHARQFIRGFVFQEELVDKLLEGLGKAGLELER